MKRRCAHPGCITILASDNRKSKCSVHQRIDYKRSKVVDSGANVEPHRRAVVEARRPHKPEVPGSTPGGATEDVTSAPIKSAPESRSPTSAFPSSDEAPESESVEVLERLIERTFITIEREDDRVRLEVTVLGDEKSVVRCYMQPARARHLARLLLGAAAS